MSTSKPASKPTSELLSTSRPSRDYRIDFWRGLALLTIFVNHVPGNLLGHLTHRNWGVSDSAELFVFIAGFSAALAYFGKFLADPLVATGRVLQRAWRLYSAHIVLLVVAVALFFGAAMALRDVHWAEAYGLDMLSTEPIRAFVGLATLGHQLGYFNILPLYVVLFLLLPALMLLAARSLVLALAAASILYVWSHVEGVRLPSYPADGGWFFEPLRWQLLFAIGFTAGALYRDGRPVPFHPLAYAAALAVVAAGAVVALAGLFPENVPPGPAFLWSFDKSGLGLPRLAHVLALIYVVAHAPYGLFDRMIARLGPDSALVRIGRHGLAMFCLGSILAVLGQIAVRAGGDALDLGTLIVILGIGLHIAAAHGLDWWRARAAASPAASPAAAHRPAAAAPADRTSAVGA